MAPACAETCGLEANVFIIDGPSAPAVSSEEFKLIASRESERLEGAKSG
jgi:hypothetical protein